MSKNRWERTGNRPNWLSQTQRDINSERSRMIDVDGVLFCDRCKKIYLVYEEEVYKERNITFKGHFVTKQIAVSLGVPAYVAQVHLIDKFDDENELCGRTVNFITVWKINPEQNKTWELTEQEWQNHLMKYRDKHERICPFPSGLRWDKEKQQDVED